MYLIRSVFDKGVELIGSVHSTTLEGRMVVVEVWLEVKISLL